MESLRCVTSECAFFVLRKRRCLQSKTYLSLSWLTLSSFVDNKVVAADVVVGDIAARPTSNTLVLLFLMLALFFSPR